MADLSPLEVALRSRPNEIEIIEISDREQWLALRQRDVTASVAGALLGASPYMTPYGLHMLKAGLAEEDVDATPRISENSIFFPPAARGHSFEPVVVDHVKQLCPDWRISYGLDRYWRAPSVRIGATPDSFAIDPEREGFGIIQIKTTSDFLFDKTWTDPDTHDVVIPLWIAVQAMVEAVVTNASWAAVAVMISGMRTETHLIEIPFSNALWQRLVAEVSAFWDRIAAGTPPDPDYGRDAQWVAQLYANSNGNVVDLEGERADRLAKILEERAGLKAREADGNDAAKTRKVLDVEIIHILGNAEAARLPDGRVIRARTTKRDTYTVAATSYRTVTVKGNAA